MSEFKQPIRVRLQDMASQEGNDTEEYDLMQEAADEIRKLEAEVARLKARKEFWKDEATCYRDDAEAAEAKLRAVEKWPDKWIEIYGWDKFDVADWLRDELEALLK